MTILFLLVIALMQVNILHSEDRSRDGYYNFERTYVSDIYDALGFSKWPSYPISAQYFGNQNMISSIESAISYIESEIGVDVFDPIIVDANNIHKANVYIFNYIDSPEIFSSAYNAISKDRFGVSLSEDELNDQILSIETTFEAPCLTVARFNPNRRLLEDLDAGVLIYRMPDFMIINIGLKNSELQFLDDCLIEELSHAAFFIPDRTADNGHQTMFNANPFPDSIDHFSKGDISAIQFYLNDNIKSGMSLEEALGTQRH